MSDRINRDIGRKISFNKRTDHGRKLDYAKIEHEKLIKQKKIDKYINNMSYTADTGESADRHV